jgi:hypothetical protein
MAKNSFCAEKLRKAKQGSKRIVTGEDLENADKWGWEWNSAR